MTDATHASFFSGVGGLDLGLERAGWRTVSFSEIDPYASAVLAERWPGVPNLGDITSLAGVDGSPRPRVAEGRRDGRADLRSDGGQPRTSGASSDPLTAAEDREWAGDRLVASGAATATLWSGGFPCQDLSVAGKRRGFGLDYSLNPIEDPDDAPDIERQVATRSGLAFSFLELVGRHRPRFVLLENVPGLLSSHAGRDFGTLLAALVELGYGVGYRVLDARYFGVPQRRRRVFILGDSTGGRAGAEFAAEVLSVGSRCRRHPPTGVEAGEEPADGARPGVDIVGPLDTALGHHGAGWPDQSVSAGHLVGASPDPDGMRAADGLAQGPHDRDGLAYVNALDQRRGGADDNEAQAGQLVTAFVKGKRAQTDQDDETWRDGDVMPTLNAFDVGDSRTTAAILGGAPSDDPLLPLGLDSHRYRCCGNGVVADVAEFIGARLLAAIESAA